MTTAQALAVRPRSWLFMALLAAPLLVLLVDLARAQRHGHDRAVATSAVPVAGWLWRSAAYPRVYFASPAGRPDNLGSAAQPLDLATALSAGGPVGPGDLLWLRGGTYMGPYRSQLAGTADAFIVVAQFPGERAILDGAAASDRTILRVEGAYTVYWGFELTNSTPDLPGQSRGTGVDVFGPYTKFINLVVHHTGTGLGVWGPALETELYGNLIFSVGWDGSDRGHGHSIYIQNNLGTKRVVDNILFDGRSFGVHAYTELGEIDNLYFEGNIAFDHGSPSSVSGAKANFLVGGYRVANRPILLSNYAYYPWASEGRNADVGYVAGCSDALIRGNYLAGGVPILLTRCSEVAMSGNQFVGRADELVAYRFPSNEYITERPRSARVFVRANRYVPGRANIAVFNWDRRWSVRVDVSGLGLRRGEPFEIRDARNYFGAPLMTATYREPYIELPLHDMKPSRVDGDSSRLPPEFGAAVILPIRSGSPSQLPWNPSGDAVH